MSKLTKYNSISEALAYNLSKAEAEDLGYIDTLSTEDIIKTNKKLLAWPDENQTQNVSVYNTSKYADVYNVYGTSNSPFALEFETDPSKYEGMLQHIRNTYYYNSFSDSVYNNMPMPSSPVGTYNDRQIIGSTTSTGHPTYYDYRQIYKNGILTSSANPIDFWNKRLPKWFGNWSKTEAYNKRTSDYGFVWAGQRNQIMKTIKISDVINSFSDFRWYTTKPIFLWSEIVDVTNFRDVIPTIPDYSLFYIAQNETIKANLEGELATLKENCTQTIDVFDATMLRISGAKNKNENGFYNAVLIGYKVNYIVYVFPPVAGLNSLFMKDDGGEAYPLTADGLIDWENLDFRKTYTKALGAAQINPNFLTKIESAFFVSLNSEVKITNDGTNSEATYYYQFFRKIGNVNNANTNYWATFCDQTLNIEYKHMLPFTATEASTIATLGQLDPNILRYDILALFPTAKTIAWGMYSTYLYYFNILMTNPQYATLAAAVAGSWDITKYPQLEENDANKAQIEANLTEIISNLYTLTLNYIESNYFTISSKDLLRLNFAKLKDTTANDKYIRFTATTAGYNDVLTYNSALHNEEGWYGGTINPSSGMTTYLSKTIKYTFTPLMFIEPTAVTIQMSLESCKMVPTSSNKYVEIVDDATINVTINPYRMTFLESDAYANGAGPTISINPDWGAERWNGVIYTPYLSTKDFKQYKITPTLGSTNPGTIRGYITGGYTTISVSTGSIKFNATKTAENTYSWDYPEKIYVLMPNSFAGARYTKTRIKEDCDFGAVIFRLNMSYEVLSGTNGTTTGDSTGDYITPINYSFKYKENVNRQPTPPISSKNETFDAMDFLDLTGGFATNTDGTMDFLTTPQKITFTSKEVDYKGYTVKMSGNYKCVLSFIGPPPTPDATGAYYDTSAEFLYRKLTEEEWQNELAAGNRVGAYYSTRTLTEESPGVYSIDFPSILSKAKGEDGDTYAAQFAEYYNSVTGLYDHILKNTKQLQVQVLDGRLLITKDKYVTTTT